MTDEPLMLAGVTGSEEALLLGLAQQFRPWPVRVETSDRRVWVSSNDGQSLVPEPVGEDRDRGLLRRAKRLLRELTVIELQENLWYEFTADGEAGR